MKLRPCIDIHDGKVKQIVGASLKDGGGSPVENFVSAEEPLYYAKLFHELGLKGGHIILLNHRESPLFPVSKALAMKVLKAFPDEWQLGGGVTAENAAEYLEAGASQVIVTSYVFHNGRVDPVRLRELVRKTGRERLVLDLSCKRHGKAYYVVTDRWQTMTETKIEPSLLDRLKLSCAEFLIHAADAEGKRGGIEEDLIRTLSLWEDRVFPITCAGGVGSLKDLEKLYALSGGRVDITVGSALSMFGGKLAPEELLQKLAGLERQIDPDAPAIK